MDGSMEEIIARVAALGGTWNIKNSEQSRVADLTADDSLFLSENKNKTKTMKRVVNKSDRMYQRRKLKVNKAKN